MHFPWQAQYKLQEPQRCYIGDPGADFLRGVAFGRIRSSVLLKMIFA